jgi:hypothetical protein
LKSVSRWFFALALGAGMIATTAIPAHAERPCERRVRKAEMNYREAVRRHGEHSRQAEQRRREVEQARARCR